MTIIQPKQTSHWDAKFYSENSKPQYEEGMALLNKCILKGNENILDIGCGDGRMSREMAARVPQGNVLAIDASEEMLTMAYSGPNPSNLKFQLLPAEAIHFDKEFDVVFSLFCLQWVADKALAFRKIYQALKPQGRFFMILPLPQAHIGPVRNELIKEAYWQPFFKDYSNPLRYASDVHYEKYARDAGFNIDVYREEEKLFSYQTEKNFIGFLKAISPHISRLPTEKDKDDFVQATVDRLLGFYPLKADGSFVIPFTIVTLIATRRN